MDRERWDNWLENGILGLVLAILTWGPLALGGVRPQEFLILQFLTVGVLLLWLVRIWLNPDRLLWTPACWGVVAFVVYAIGRYATADIEYVARQEFIKVLVYTALFFAVLNNLHRQNSTQIVVGLLVGLAVLVSAYAVYQYLTNSEYVWHFIKPKQYMKRAGGSYICPNHLAGLLEMILPLALAYTLTGRYKPLPKVFLGYAAFVILAGLGVTISRGGWIASGLSLIVLFAILVRQRDYRLPAILALVVLLGCGVTFVAKSKHSRERFSRMLVSGHLEDVRFRLWKPAYEMWQTDPWWGVGPAHFDYRWRQFRPADVQMRPDRVHNDYLNTLTDWGIVGTSLVAAVWIALYWGVFKTWKFVSRSGSLSARNSNRTSFVLGSGVGLLAILLHSVVDFNFHIPANAILAVVLMALLSSHSRFSSDRYWINPRHVGRALVTLLGLVGIFYLSTQGVRAVKEWRRLEEAAKHEEAGKPPESSLARVPFLKQAFAVEPQNARTAYDIGETLRVESFQGDRNYRQLAEEALQWFGQSIRINPYDGYAHLRYGMCLHWLGRHAETEPSFKRALELDPNGYYVVAHQGWHLFQRGDYAGAKPFFERSLTLKPASENPIAASYLNIVRKKLEAAATP